MMYEKVHQLMQRVNMTLKNKSHVRPLIPRTVNKLSYLQLIAAEC